MAKKKKDASENGIQNNVEKPTFIIQKAPDRGAMYTTSLRLDSDTASDIKSLSKDTNQSMNTILVQIIKDNYKRYQASN